ncbi:MAG: sigma 54-interacting transcriptional regulator [Acidobacteria bacterium]|nr:sigma 54-interacting transcriptional regulator [Acidobacteriota bacterium]
MKKAKTDAGSTAELTAVTLTGELIGRKTAPVAGKPVVDELFSSIGKHLRDGRSSEAELLVRKTLPAYRFSPDEYANLLRLLAFTLETVGKYKESLEAVRPYDDPQNLANLSSESQVRVITQLAISFSNRGDYPKAVTLLKEALEEAKTSSHSHLLGTINIGLSRVYRKLNEFPISRDFAEKALDQFRSTGNWLGMAEAYREIANIYNQEGNSEKAIENFQLGIKIIGSNSAPFMLGKLYTDMSGAYWFLRKPNDGIECLEKSIEFFDQTEHALNMLIAYNNLGINLTLLGQWQRAEEMIRRALDLGLRENYAHVAGIYDSLAELYILRGDIDEAEQLLQKAVQIAEERNNRWYKLQAMRNVARCQLLKGDVAAAIVTAEETIEQAHDAGDKHYANMAGIVLAEGLLLEGDTEESENSLREIESNEPRSDYFVLGNIQRIRGLLALENDERELAIHHFSRALTTFEAGFDPFHQARMHLLLAENLGSDNIVRARRHLAAAAEIYKQLGLDADLHRVQEANRRLEAESKVLPKRPGGERRKNAVISQLLTVRLAEATASRELLFRELVAVLQQESNADKIAIAEYNEAKTLTPFITHGFSSQESFDLVAKLDAAVRRDELKEFSRSRNVEAFELRPTAGRPAFLLLNPRSGACLTDGSSLTPLISVTELGIDVIALRERDRAKPQDAPIGIQTSNNVMPGFIHSSPGMTALVEEIYKIRNSDVTVLVTGESGTGKELVSKAIHTISNRKDQVFVPFNCTAVPKELAEGMLFGYKKGAFTGAMSDQPGVIRSADHGTLFLDEIGDLPLDVQPKLLRFLQEGEVQPLGEKRPIKVDVRIIAATNMPLEEKVADGTFREDLYFRLNVIRLRVPPLRDRRAEIPSIVNYHVAKYSERFNKTGITFTPQTIDMLMVSDWEGNVRELCNEIQRIVARAESNDIITPEHLSPDLKRSAKPLTPFGGKPQAPRPIVSFNSTISPFANLGQGTTLDQAVSELEMSLIRDALSRNNWNISRVAAELGLTRRGLYLKLARYGIEKAA